VGERLVADLVIDAADPQLLRVTDDPAEVVAVVRASQARAEPAA
jgi:hypothetical protein